MSTPTLTVNTGNVRYQLLNEYGQEIGVLQFNPLDIDIVRRADLVEEFFRGINVDQDVTVAKLVEINNEIKEQFNFLLNNKDAADNLFGSCNPLAPTEDGTFYFAVLLEHIIKVIEETTEMKFKSQAKKIEDAVADIIE